jgi:hypothetical protein
MKSTRDRVTVVSPPWSARVRECRSAAASVLPFLGVNQCARRRVRWNPSNLVPDGVASLLMTNPYRTDAEAIGYLLQEESHYVRIVSYDTL